NLLLAYQKAAKGKRGHLNVARFEFHLEKNLLLLQEKLITKLYTPATYVNFYIHEPKRRLISAAPFPDRVVHHALCNVIEPLFERSFIFDSYANRRGKGTHRARTRTQQFARQYRYFLHLDIQKFFPTIDHLTLKQALCKKVKDQQIVRLIELILSSGAQIHSVCHPNKRPKGLPIGNLTSQFWANVYMNPLDHYIKRTLRCTAYLRYVDDFVLFSNSKRTLHRWHSMITSRLNAMHLTLHDKAHPKPVTEGIPFLGFIIFPESIRLKRRKGIYYKHKLKRLLSSGADAETIQASIQGWRNHVRYGNTAGLQQAMLSNLVVPTPYDRKTVHKTVRQTHRNDQQYIQGPA
ncbi:MAG: reverse transcriptase domain-containing protein, partial [Rhodothermales bacterium]